MPCTAAAVVNLPRATVDRPGLRLASLIAAVAAMLVTMSGRGAWSQTPRTVKLIVPVVPGGAPDILARVLSEHFGRTPGQTMVVENRPGASAVIGTEAVARAAPDGGTLLMSTAQLVINPHLRKLSFDPLTDLEPICDAATAPTLVAVNSASPYRTLADLLDAARSRPGALTLASIGPASSYHIAFEMLRRMADFNMTFVPYAGSAPAISAVLGDHVTAVFTDYASLAEQLKAGKLRALATGSRTRIEPLPDLPTIAESGYKDFELNVWFGVLAPGKTPKETISQFIGWFTVALQSPEIKARFALQGFYPVGSCGADFGAMLRKQYDDFGRIIREAGIRAE
jgi:tripartite-type tricarboxylate transporter receptor subunit TctC